MGVADQLSAAGAISIGCAVYLAPSNKDLSNKVGYVGSGLLLLGGLGDLLKFLTAVVQML
jgi:hypothetical protein